MIPTPGDIVEANGLRYKVEAVDDVSVTYRTWLGACWSDERAIVRASWVALVSVGWVGPGRAAPGWVDADGDL